MKFCKSIPMNALSDALFLIDSAEMKCFQNLSPTADKKNGLLSSDSQTRPAIVNLLLTFICFVESEHNFLLIFYIFYLIIDFITFNLIYQN